MLYSIVSIWREGWYKNLERDRGISFFNYMRSRFKMPERTYDSNSDPELRDDIGVA
jgi:hypothetical protein